MRLEPSLDIDGQAIAVHHPHQIQHHGRPEQDLGKLADPGTRTSPRATPLRTARATR
jgi:hypothetical protein